jgi:hypothetical protein
MLGADITGKGSFDHGYGINLTKRLRPFMVHADVIPGFPVETRVDGKRIQYGMYLNYDLGAEYLFLHGLNIMVEMNGYWQAASKIEGVEASDTKNANLSISAGVGWACDNVQTLLAYQRTISGKNTAVINGMVFSLVYDLSFGK